MTFASAAFLIMVLAVYLLLATTLGLLGGALARLAFSGRAAAAIRIGIPVFLGAFGFAMAGTIAFGATVRPNVQAKLVMLDRGLSEVVACAPIAVSASAVGIAAALYVAIRQLRRSALVGR
jgi:hypothetical protein